MHNYFDLLSKITDIEIVAVNTSIRDITYLRKTYGAGRWRKLKGIAKVRLPDGTICRAEVIGTKHMESVNGI